MWPLLLLACSSAVLRIPGPLDELVEPAPRVVAPKEVAPREAAVAKVAPAEGGKVAEAAVAFLGASRLTVKGETYRFDCSGLVEAAYAKAGAVWTGSTEDLFHVAREQGVLHRRRTPSPGDIAFFDDTYDRDGNGRRDDPLSHSAVVVAVAEDGTVEMVHVGSKGVVSLRMNLRHPEERLSPEGAVWNDYLRAPGKHDSPRTRYLAGELWVGFGSLWKLPTE